MRPTHTAREATSDNNAPETHPPPGFLESTPPDISAPKITSRQPHPKHLHIRPITPFLVPGGMDLRGEARSATTDDLWRWVFSRPGREAGSGTTTRRVWRQYTGNRIFQPRRGRRKGSHNRGSSQRQIRQIGTFETEQAGAFVTAPGASKTQRH